MRGRGGVPTADSDIHKSLTKQIRLASSEDLKAGKFDEVVLQAFKYAKQRNEIKGFRAIAFALFAGRQNGVRKINLALLQKMLVACDRHVSIQIQSLESVLFNAFDSWKEHYLEPDTSTAEPQSCFGRYVFDPSQKDNPQAKVRLIFGGGLYFFREVKACESKGYALDHVGNKFPGYGMYFTPVGSGYESRAYNYAIRAAARNFDLPVIVEVEIEQQYLVKTPNSAYEVGVLVENFDKIVVTSQNVLSFTQCANRTTDRNPYGEILFITENSVGTCYAQDSSVYQDFLTVQDDENQFLRTGYSFN